MASFPGRRIYFRRPAPGTIPVGDTLGSSEHIKASRPVDSDVKWRFLQRKEP
jgi:hypothetical protein